MQGLSDSVYRDCLNSIPLTNTLTTGVVVVNDRETTTIYREIM